ncbi:MAG: sugar phosphate nucleotidyltransferase [Candidatus Nanohaloarchaea archaeon]
MKAVIPCAKKKRGLFPFSETKPTALMPVAGKPIISHLIHNLQQIGVEEIYLVTNHLEQQFEEKFGEYTNVNIVHQEKLEGTASAIQECSFIDENFFVVNGDVLISQHDLKKLLENHGENTQVSMLADKEDKPEKFGVLSITNDKVSEIYEKPEEPENPLVNTGIYIFTPEIFNAIKNLEDSKDLTDAVKNFVPNRETRFEIVDDYWIDIGSPKKLWEADKIKREYEIQETQISDSAKIHDSVKIEGEAIIDERAEIKPNTVIEGKTYIGKETTIGPNTVVKDSSIHEASQLRNNEIENSLIFEENIIDPYTHLENTIIGEQCDIKPGTVIRESFIGGESFIEMNNSIYGKKFVPNARTDLSEITK